LKYQHNRRRSKLAVNSSARLTHERASQRSRQPQQPRSGKLDPVPEDRVRIFKRHNGNLKRIPLRMSTPRRGILIVTRVQQ